MAQETTVDPRLAEITQPIADPTHAGTQGTERPDRVASNNQLFNEVVAQGDAACTILAGIRWCVLNMGRKTYADETGVARDVVRRCEDVASRHTLVQRYDTIQKFIAYWRTRPEVGPVLTQAAIDAILAEHANTVYGLFLELEYRLGHGVVTGHTGTTLAGIRKYKDTPQSYVPYARIQAVTDAIPLLTEQGVDIERMQNVWASEARQALTGPRQVPPPLAELHVRDDLQGTRLFDGHRSHENVNRSAEYSLARFEMRPWEEIADIALQLVSDEEADAFKAAWDEAYATEAARETFYQRLVQMQTARGISNHKLKRILGIEGMRPFTLLRDPTLAGKANANVDAPPAVLAHLVAEDPTEAEETIQLFREDRTRWRVRMGSLNAECAVRLDREQWGVTNQELVRILETPALTKDWKGDDAAALQACRSRGKKWKHRDLVRMENAQGKLGKTDEQDARLQGHLRTIIAALGQQKLAAAIERRDSYHAPKTVMEAVARLAEEAAPARTSETHKEYRQFAIQARENAPHGSSGQENLWMYCSRHHIRRYAEGIEVPALPVLLHLLQAGGIEDEKVLEILKLDWADRFAVQLAGKNTISPTVNAGYPKHNRIPKELVHPTQHPPLARALLHCIGRVSPNMTQFARTRFENAGAADMVTQCIKLLDAESTNAQSVAWTDIQAILLAADIANDSPTWKFVRTLYDEEEHVKRTVSKMSAQGIEGDPMLFPGLTKEDLRKG